MSVLQATNSFVQSLHLRKKRPQTQEGCQTFLSPVNQQSCICSLLSPSCKIENLQGNLQVLILTMARNLK